jgi:tripartite-type tricarboxylate transporter receptor subunit TctC
MAQGRVARLCGAQGLPKEIAAQYETAIKKIWDSAEFQGVHEQARLRHDLSGFGWSS